VTFTSSIRDAGNTPVYRWYINGQSAGQNSDNFFSQNLSNGDVVTCVLVSSLDCTVPATSNQVTMTINTNTDRVIPSAFTPNGDGINDRWVVSGLNASPVFVQIFDRHSAIVYQSKNYPNDFDGSLNGTPLPFGTYYYIIRQTGQPALSGALTILR
jgi:gliding motility-associated-like protein